MPFLSNYIPVTEHEPHRFHYDNLPDMQPTEQEEETAEFARNNFLLASDEL